MSSTSSNMLWPRDSMLYQRSSSSHQYIEAAFSTQLIMEYSNVSAGVDVLLCVCVCVCVLGRAHMDGVASYEFN